MHRRHQRAFETGGEDTTQALTSMLFLSPSVVPPTPLLLPLGLGGSLPAHGARVGEPNTPARGEPPSTGDNKRGEVLLSSAAGEMENVGGGVEGNALAGPFVGVDGRDGPSVVRMGARGGGAIGGGAGWDG